MIHTTSARHLTLAIAAAFGLLSAVPVAMAQTATHKPAAKKAAKAAPKAAVDLTPTASAEQIDAAQRVYYGKYDCELGEKLDVVADDKHPSYVEVKHVKANYLMKPVLSTTGAIRLEDVRGEVLMVQIAAKSMLLNTKTGHRIVDACVSPKQRETLDAPKTTAVSATPAG